MTSSGDAERPRHLGRVVDPLAREDGGTEPRVEMEPDGGASPAPEPTDPLVIPPESPDADDAPLADDPRSPLAVGPRTRGGTHVRDRLLAKAESARRSRLRPRDAAEPDVADPGDYGPPRPLEAELELIGATGRRTAARRARPPLTANTTAALGSLLGLAVVASLFALVIRLDPRRSAAAVDRPPEPISSAAPIPAPAPSPVAKKPPRHKLPGPWRVQDGAGDPALRLVEGEMGSDPFLKRVQKAGLTKRDAYRVYTALKGVVPLDRCKRTDKFAALVHRSGGTVSAFEYSESKEDVFQAREDAQGLLQGVRLDFEVERTRVQGALALDSGHFVEQAEAAGFEPALASAVAKAIEGHAGLDDFSRGDTLRVVAQEVTVLGEFSRYAGIEAFEWHRRSGDSVRIYWFDGERERGYFDADGRSPSEGGWRRPIPGAPITSRFNPKRFHPILKRIMPHEGIDFGAAMGTPVGASSYGTVSFIGYAGPTGNLVKIQHAGPYETGYAHLSRFEAGLKLGDRVKRLQIVGYVGSTGRSTGPHLHFSVKKKGVFIDPETLHLDAMRVLPEGERSAFGEAKRKLDALLDEIPLPAPLVVEEPAAPLAPSASATSGPADPATLEDPTEDVAEQPAKTVSTASPTPPVPASSAPRSPTTSAGSSLYLSDKELLGSQPAEDDGEVEE